MAYEHLREPTAIAGVELRNRLFMPAHSTNFAERTMSERLVHYYVARARAGVGLIVQEPAIVHPSSLSRPTKVWAYDEANIPHLRRAADAVHAAGAKLFCQLLHNGAHMGGYFSGMPLWAPSELFDAAYGEYAHEMTLEEIGLVVEGFATSARNLEAAGYDGVEIHGSHGYLIQQFLSPLSNRRTDEYGGSFANRLRILEEVVAAIRSAVSPGFVVGVRLAGSERVSGGLTEADAIAAVHQLEVAGGVDFIDVVSGGLASEQWIVPDGTTPRRLNADLAGAIKAKTSLPVLVAGRIAEPEEAEQVLAAGQADLVGVVRPLIADPRWLAKALAGEPETIRPCTYCNECSTGIGRYRPIHCTVNPDMGHEGEGAVDAEEGPAPTRRRVVVVGGGPAGTECALAAAARGHEVTLFERRDELGGQLSLGRALPSRAEATRIIGYLAAAVLASPIETRLGTPATVEAVMACRPDAVVLATGSSPVPPGLPGSDRALSADAVLAGEPVPGRRVVVCGEAGADWSFELALEQLADEGREVIAVTPQPSLSFRPSDRGLPARLLRAGVELVCWHRAVAVEDGAVVVRHVVTGTELSLGAEVAVLATRRTSASRLAQELVRAAGAAGAAGAVRIQTIGDGLAPRGLYEAIVDGRRVGSLIGEARGMGDEGSRP